MISSSEDANQISGRLFRKKVLLVSRCAWTLFNFRAGLIRELKKRGYVVLGGGAEGDGFESRIEALGIPFVSIPVDKKGINPWADLNLLWTLYRWYRTERPDVVHHFTIKPVIYGSLAASLAGVPKIVNTVTGLGFVFMEEQLSSLRRLVKWQYRVALRCADFTFFQNRDDRDLFVTERLVHPGKAGLLPGSGIDCAFFAPPLVGERRAGVPVTFLMVARLLREKGVYEYVDAARIVKGKFPETQFQLLGRRDVRNPSVVQEADIEGWQKEGVITWLGDVPDVRPVVARADVIVLPSYREGTPRALLEAAAMCKPLIATDVTGCREVVEEGMNGLLVPMKDPKALAEAMLSLIKGPELRASMGKAGREKVAQEFDEREVIEKIIRVYDEVQA